VCVSEKKSLWECVGWVDGWVDGWMDGQMDGWTEILFLRIESWK